VDAAGQVLDRGWAVPFGFREFWIDGRDFYLNGIRIFLSAVPLDNAQISAALATYQAARESLERLKSFGINFVLYSQLWLRTGLAPEFRRSSAGGGRRGIHARTFAMARPKRVRGGLKEPSLPQARGHFLKPPSSPS